LQCSNYYRSLILAGRVTDPNYFIDEDGKIRYKFKSKAGDGVCCCRARPLLALLLWA
jgi:hypothetical protein